MLDIDVHASSVIEDKPIDLPRGVKVEYFPCMHSKDALKVGFLPTASSFVNYLRTIRSGNISKSTRAEEMLILFYISAKGPIGTVEDKRSN